MRATFYKVLTQQPIASLLAIACLLAVSSGDRWVAFGGAGALALCLTVLRGKMFVRPLAVLLPLVLMFVAALAVTVFAESSVVAASRGAFYFVRPVLFAYLGYVLAKSVKTDHPIIFAASIFGAWAALQYVYAYYNDPLVQYYSREDIRKNLGTGDLLLWLVPCLLFLLWGQFRSPLDRMLMLGASALAMAAIVFSTSRSAYLSIGIFVLVLLLSPKRLRGIQGWIAPVSLVLLAVTTPLIAYAFDMHVLVDLSDGPLRELAPPPPNIGLINEQWRGFETWRVFDHMRSQPVEAILFGTGLATEIPLGMAQTLGGELTQQIGVFHNGFSFAYVRAGLLGLFLYVWLAHRVVHPLLTSLLTLPAEETLLVRIGLASILVLIIGSPTIGGFFNPDQTGAVAFLLFGAALARSKTAQAAVPSIAAKQPTASLA